MTPPGGDLIAFRCACGKKLKLPASAAGRLAKCPRCGQPARVPTPEPEPDPAAATESPTRPRADALDDLILEEVKAPALPRRPQPAGAAPPRSPRPASPPPPAPGADAFELAPLPPEVDAAAEAAAAELTQSCPACGRGWPGAARVCTDCGVYLATGKAIVTTQEDNLDEVYMRAQSLAWVVSWLFVPFVYPIASEAFGFRRPYVIRAIAGLTVIASILFFFSLASDRVTGGPYGHLMLWGGDRDIGPVDWADVAAQLRDMGFSETEIDEAIAIQKQLLQKALPQPAAYQLLTYQFLHADHWHLIGNLMFLLVLGSRVNALLGQAWTVVLYPLFGVVAGLAQAAAWGDGPVRAMLGASGAIAGLAGMYLVFFPIQKVHVVFWWRFLYPNILHLHLKFFEIRGYWFVVLVFGWDVLFVYLRAETGVAHWAHLGGFIAGATAASLLLFTRLINGRGSDLFTTLLGRRAWILVGRPRAT